MNLLEQEIRASAPRRVREFGSGLSTACLARYMAENAPGSRRPVVVSVEENADFCAEARALVAELGLDEVAAINHAPLVRKDVAGRTVNAYDLPADLLAEFEEEPADLVFIDGPGMAGGRFSRWAVLHTPCCPCSGQLPVLPRRRALGFRARIRAALGRAPRRRDCRRGDGRPRRALRRVSTS